MDNVAHLYRITNTKTGEYYVGRKHMNDGQKNYFVTEKDILEKGLFDLVPGRLKVGV